MLNFQNKTLKVKIDRSRDNLLTEFGKTTLTDRYLGKDESYQDLFARVAVYYADDAEHAQRLYDYISQLWFMPATPVLSNGGNNRGLPISCFLNEVLDTLHGIRDVWDENIWLASKGGGIGSYWGNVRSIGEQLKKGGACSGIIPFIVVQDALTLAISQGSLRRGSAAVYLQDNHPEIEEFLEIRKPTGGDHNRKALNLNHGVCITDEFMEAVANDDVHHLRSPHDNKIMSTIKARDLWIKLLTMRIETGEPYLLFVDRLNELAPETYKKLGLKCKTSNLCSEITLATGEDHLGKNRTAVCCLSSINLENYDKFEGNEQFLEDILRFLDNVIQDFIDKSPEEMHRASYSAMRERSIGLGVMGFHGYLQSKMIPFESALANGKNRQIFSWLKTVSDKVSKKLAKERGACEDGKECGIEERFTHKLAIAPTASISIICGESSPGIEPFAANCFMYKTLSGSFLSKNKHLTKLLTEKNQNSEEVWESISANLGSVEHLDFLDDYEKSVFRTAYELNQHYIIEHAAVRTPYICQAQSLNLFLPANVSKQYLHDVHYNAWKKGVKSLYYMRSQTIQRGDKVSQEQEYKECLSCQ